jgi:hypothetical protein
MQEGDRRCINTLLARLVGQDNNFTMTIQKPDEVTDDNNLKVTEEDLNVAHKQQLKKAIEDYKQACLGAFNVIKRGEAIQKNTFPKPREIKSLKTRLSSKTCSTKLCITQRSISRTF